MAASVCSTVMSQGEEQYQVAYFPLPRGVIKEEPEFEEERDELISREKMSGVENNVCSTDMGQEEYQQYQVTYLPLPRGVIKEEMQSDEDPDERDEGKQHLIVYAPLPQVFKEEFEFGEESDELISGEQRRNLDKINEEPIAQSEAASIIPFITPETAEATNFTKPTCGTKREMSENRIASSGDTPATDGKEDLAPSRSTAGPSKSNQKASGKHYEKVQNNPKERGKGPHKCTDCPSSFKLEKYLKEHMKLYCNSANLPARFTCKECGHQSKRKADLKRHLIKIHNTENFAASGAGPKIRPVLPFKCAKCGKTYKEKRGLTKHLRYECEKDPLYPCNLCDYRTKQKWNLRNHLMGVHFVDCSQSNNLGATEAPPQKPFICEKCGRSYTAKKSLKRHLKIKCTKS